MQDRSIHFWFDFSSPYSYIASEWVEALAARHGRVTRWHAVLLGVTFQAAGLRSPVDHPIKRDYTIHDFERSARYEGVPYVHPARFPIPTQLAARVFWWLDAQDPQRAVDWAHAALRAYFARGVQLDEPAALKQLAAASGIDPDAAERAWNDPQWKDKLRHVNQQAIDAGMFGAPYIVVDGEPFWGNDRKPQVERWLSQGPF
jgi:2-hydroxychromene-2-carboxylate isomerase